MNGLEPPDSHYLSAAVGWLELGRREEAKAELKQISAEKQQHPEVLSVSWKILADEQQWSAALAVARQLVSAAPRRADGWVFQAYSLRRAPEGGLSKAWETLRGVADQFPEEMIFPFNLACYACQLDRVEEARAWLRRAMKVGGRDTVKKMALADSDLEALWEEIRKL